MKVIDNQGRVLPVDDSSINYNTDVVYGTSAATLITDDVFLKPVWIATCERNTAIGIPKRERNGEMEFAAEKVFDHEPSHEELIYFMCQNLCGRFDYVYVKNGFKLCYLGD